MANIARSAVVSPCGLYRYRLDREDFDAPGKLSFGFFGVNPSTADGKKEDQTSLKWMEFTRRNDGCRYTAGNALPWIATNVRELAQANNPYGENDRYLDEIIGCCDVLVPCWGDRGKLPRQLQHYLWRLRDRIFASGKPVKVFGFTKSGDPKHPLMLGYATALIDWERP